MFRRKESSGQTSAKRPEERLYSWKEIAGYLGREPRTVRRWEAAEALPVHRLQHGKSGSVYALKSELDAWMTQRSSAPSAHLPERPRLGFLTLWAVAITSTSLLVLAGGLILSRKPPRPHINTVIRFASDPGTALEARLSPNGSQVAYVWNGDTEENFDIYVRLIAGSAPLRLTTHPAPDYSPAWSPDGSQIAFLRRTAPAAAAVFLIPALGGAERKIAEFRASEWAPWSRPGPLLTWSPVGPWLVTSGMPAEGGSDVLLGISGTTGQTAPLTTAPPKTMGDMAPAFSPDGRAIAFSRFLSWGRSELCLLPVNEVLQPTGQVRILKTGSTWNTSPAWLPGKRTIVFSSGSMDASHLARIDPFGSAEAERIPGVGEYGWGPSLARAADGRIGLIYTQHFESVNIWRAPVDGSGPPVQLIASAHWSYEPAWSPDGRRIAFLSDRTGNGEVWVADADGRNARQWTFLKQPRLGGPRWSPDSRRLAFTAPGAQGSSIYLIDGPGEQPRPVPGSEQSGYLEWAHDGRAIYFSSNRGSGVEIWRVAPDGGTALRVTDAGGRVPAISADGRYLYYLKLASGDGRNDLWRRPLENGPEEKILEFADAYSLGGAGIAFKYYSPGPRPVGPHLQFFRFPAGRTERLPDPPRPMRYGIALSPDGRYLLHAQADYQVGDLMLVEDFR